MLKISLFLILPDLGLYFGGLEDSDLPYLSILDAASKVSSTVIALRQAKSFSQLCARQISHPTSL